MLELKVSKLKKRLKKALGKEPRQNRCAMVMLEYLVERDAKVSNMAAENLALRQEIQRLQIHVENVRDISDQQRNIKMQLMARLREAEQKVEQAEKERFEALEKLYSYRNICGVTTPERLVELLDADREGRIAILSEPMKPMVYKPNDTDVYCPNCGETLSGGWPLSDADDCRKMYQCFYCGQLIDTEKCEPYESDLKERGNDV